MAQDFYRISHLGQDSTAIGTVDADGVALVAAQALDQQQRQLASASREPDAARLDRLEQRSTPPMQAVLPWLGRLLLAGMGSGLLRRPILYR